jgi:hypothetical protein
MEFSASIAQEPAQVPAYQYVAVLRIVLRTAKKTSAQAHSPKMEKGHCRSEVRMCRNIKMLFNFDPPVTSDEVRAASLQYIRKISGFNKPSKANEAAFLAAVDEVAEISSRLLRSLETTAAPKNREEEAARAKARSAERYRA